jgi:pyridoxamine 5'-phosphate oxidase family protein
MGAEDVTSVLSDAELDYLQGRRLGRLATLGEDGYPHVVPVAFRHDREAGAIDVGERRLAEPERLHDVRRRGVAALLVDDLPTQGRLRAVEVCGDAVALETGGKAMGRTSTRSSGSRSAGSSPGAWRPNRRRRGPCCGGSRTSSPTSGWVRAPGRAAGMGGLVRPDHPRLPQLGHERARGGAHRLVVCRNRVRAAHAVAVPADGTRAAAGPPGDQGEGDAYEYYRRQDGSAFYFPGDEGRRRAHGYLDFAYFSLAIASTFGTTDVKIHGDVVRRSVLLHEIISVWFNLGVIAAVVALALG